MLNVLLTIHLIACTGLVILVMLQRSEGGALGMSGGGTGGLISGRGAATALVRTTMILAAVFFVTSLAMTRFNSEVARAPTATDKAIETLKTAPSATPTPVPSASPTPAIAATPDPLAPLNSPAVAPGAPANLTPTTTPTASPATAPSPTATPPASTTPAPSPAPNP